MGENEKVDNTPHLVKTIHKVGVLLDQTITYEGRILTIHSRTAFARAAGTNRAHFPSCLNAHTICGKPEVRRVNTNVRMHKSVIRSLLLTCFILLSLFGSV